MSLDQPDIKELRALVNWVNLSDDVRELSVTFGGVELFISKDRYSTGHRTDTTSVNTAPALAPALMSAAPAAMAAPSSPPVSDPPASAGAQLAGDEVLIKAPMVGIFYGSPKPGDPPFVQVGDRVSASTVLGIVEVMKLMNNIEATVSGVVARILVDNEQAVEYGQALMVIRRDA